jgi:hypothetical protein
MSDCSKPVEPTPWGVTKLEKGGTSPGITPPTRIDIDPSGRFRLYTRTGPYAPTVEEMRAAKVDPEAPQKGQQVFTVAFGILYWDGERWCSLAD